MTVREATRQQRPFPGLADAVKAQHENTIENTRGSMVGFKGPDVFQGLSVADFHLHYIDDARGFGGHVLDFELSAGTLLVEAFSSFAVRCPGRVVLDGRTRRYERRRGHPVCES